MRKRWTQEFCFYSEGQVFVKKDGGLIEQHKNTLCLTSAKNIQACLWKFIYFIMAGTIPLTKTEHLFRKELAFIVGFIAALYIALLIVFSHCRQLTGAWIWLQHKFRKLHPSKTVRKEENVQTV